MIPEIVEKAYEFAKPYVSCGKVATYIPELAKVDPNQLGICVMTKNNNCYHAGDWQTPFTIQSISKIFSLIFALHRLGKDAVFSKVGVEPTGDAFNSIVKLETKDARPLNPMINAGAIVVVGTLVEKVTFEEYLEFVALVCRCNAVNIDEQVYLSEKNAGMKNRSMAYLLKDDGVLESDVETTLDFYFKACSVTLTTENLANFALVLANGGIDPISSKRLIDNHIVTIAKTLMVTCGMYDGSGEFAIRVGIPAKSGVGGGIIATVENRMGIAAFGPALDKKGNSIGAYMALEFLSQELNLHMLSNQSE